MTDEQIKHMVDRFLMWRLPENFNPDGGISFKKIYNEKTTYGPQKHEPIGTNLFDSTQAEAMIRHLVEGLPNDSIRNELIAQVAELKHDIERHIAIANKHVNRAEAAEAQVAELKKDAERYQWLKQHSTVELGEKRIFVLDGPDQRGWHLALFFPYDQMPEKVCCGSYGVSEAGQRDCGYCQNATWIISDAAIDAAKEEK